MIVGNEAVVKSLKQYEDLMLKKREIENELEIIKEEVMPHLSTGTKLQTAKGYFTVQTRLKWTYSAETRKLDTQVKDLKKREEQDGTAVAAPGDPFLVYKEGAPE